MGRWSGSSVTLRNNKIPELLPYMYRIPRSRHHGYLILGAEPAQGLSEGHQRDEAWRFVSRGLVFEGKPKVAPLHIEASVD